jgi:protein-L-isoaspartate(D-aspartate) O-methyltransferase
MPALSQQSAPDFTAARFNMVESQIRPNKVRDARILQAMGALPREMFVPMPLAGIAYIDEDIEVAPGRFLLEPMVLARLLQEAEIRPEDRALDIAPASGYSTVVLSVLAKEVTAIESDAGLAARAAENLARLQVRNADMQQGPFATGWKARAPYDVILVNGSVEILPEALFAQLAEGGRLLVVVRQFGPAAVAHKGEARLYEKIHGNLSHRALFDANVKLLPGFEAKRMFAF